MKITPINYFSKKVIVPNNRENKSVKYMYNKVVDLAKENQLYTEMWNDRIEIHPHISAEKKLFEGLKNFGINFSVENQKFFDEIRK